MTGGILQLKCWLWELGEVWNETRTPFRNIDGSITVSLSHDTTNSSKTSNGPCYLLPVKFDIYADMFLDDPDDDWSANGVLVGLMLEATGDKFQRIGAFTINVYKKNKLFSNLTVSKPYRWIKRIGEEGRRHGAFQSMVERVICGICTSNGGRSQGSVLEAIHHFGGFEKLDFRRSKLGEG